eukprot:m.984401 g.984401  ORF g.984401 m.984401 type:complete len:55 (+) comp23979_c0_seq2:3545-3709(+)
MSLIVETSEEYKIMILLACTLWLLQSYVVPATSVAFVKEQTSQFTDNSDKKKET